MEPFTIALLVGAAWYYSKVQERKKEEAQARKKKEIQGRARLAAVRAAARLAAVRTQEEPPTSFTPRVPVPASSAPMVQEILPPSPAEQAAEGVLMSLGFISPALPRWQEAASRYLPPEKTPMILSMIEIAEALVKKEETWQKLRELVAEPAFQDAIAGYGDPTQRFPRWVRRAIFEKMSRDEDLSAVLIGTRHAMVNELLQVLGQYGVSSAAVAAANARDEASAIPNCGYLGNYIGDCSTPSPATRMSRRIDRSRLPQDL